jgi:S-phase kinase-associated protein 1
VPLPNVSGEVLAKVIVFCKYTAAANGDGAEVPAKTEDEVKAWQTEYLDIENAMLFNLILVRLRMTTTDCLERGRPPPPLCKPPA